MEGEKRKGKGRKGQVKRGEERENAVTIYNFKNKTLKGKKKKEIHPKAPVHTHR